MANRPDHPPPSPALPAEGREECGKLFRTESLSRDSLTKKQKPDVPTSGFEGVTISRQHSPALAQSVEWRGHSELLDIPHIQLEAFWPVFGFRFPIQIAEDVLRLREAEDRTGADA